MLISDLQNENGVYNGTGIEVKPFISFIEKKILCLNVLENCMDVNENGMVVCDYFLRKLVQDINIIKQYTNIEISDDNYIYEYDFLVENELLDYILDRIVDSELSFINEMINKEIKQRISVSNSIENILFQKLQLLIDKIPDEKGIKKLMTEAKKQINGIKPQQLELIKNMIGKQGQGDQVG